MYIYIYIDRYIYIDIDIGERGLDLVHLSSHLVVNI